MTELELVKQELGSPIINIELTDEQILYHISKSIHMLNNFDVSDDFATIDLAVALCKRQWGFILNKYTVSLKDSNINSEFIYQQGCDDISMILDMLYNI